MRVSEPGEGLRARCSSTMTAALPGAADDAPLVVFDFDHTFYDGDSGSHLFASLIGRNPLRMLAALLVDAGAGPMVAMLRTRRHGISGYVWIATFGMRRPGDFNRLIDPMCAHEARSARPAPAALAVFSRHRATGDRVAGHRRAAGAGTRDPGIRRRADVTVTGTRSGRGWAR
jgi:phosphatidylglycerophosphatase C